MEDDDGFYTRERWSNWMDQVREEEFDPEADDGALLFFNLQDDVTIGCVDTVEAYEDGEIDEETFLEELNEIRDVVMREVDLGDEEKEMMLDGVQTSLLAVFAACETYVTRDVEGEGSVEERVAEAARAEQEDDMDRALGVVAEAGALIIDGEGFDVEGIPEDVEYGYVTEWINGLDSLVDAVTEPETIEEDD
jgi:hypothetical protein